MAQNEILKLTLSDENKEGQDILAGDFWTTPTEEAGCQERQNGD